MHARKGFPVMCTKTHNEQLAVGGGQSMSTFN
jgi:hypothetical protein